MKLMKKTEKIPMLGRHEVSPEELERHKKMARYTLGLDDELRPELASNRAITLHAASVVQEARRAGLSKLLERAANPDI